MTKNEISNIRNNYLKDVLEYLKHLTTLSTGSIVLIATFLEKLFLKPELKGFVVVSVGGFLVSIISAAILYTIVLFYEKKTVYNPDLKTPQYAKTIGMGGFIGTWLGFIVGIVCLSIFAMKNLSV